MSRFRVTFEAITPFGAAAVLFPGGRYDPGRTPLIEEGWWHEAQREGEEEGIIQQAQTLLEWAKSGKQPIRNVRVERCQDPIWEVVAVRPAEGEEVKP